MLSDNAFSIMAPVLERVLRWHTGDIRSLFEANGLSLQEWEKARTDRITLRDTYPETATSIRSAPRRRAWTTRPGPPSSSPSPTRRRGAAGGRLTGPSTP